MWYILLNVLKEKQARRYVTDAIFEHTLEQYLNKFSKIDESFNKWYQGNDILMQKNDTEV